MSEINVSVIIPNWNGKELLKDCLSSLKKQTYKNFEIILVDNGSEDNSAKWVEKNYPKVKIVKLEKNFGFAKAINEGVKLSKAEYVVFLNNDTKADEDWLKNLVECINHHPEIISINSKILNYFNPKFIDGVGIEVNEVGQAKSIGWNEEDKGQFEKEQYIFGATGGASLFKRTDFTAVGLFDENYFMYSEEVDFAFRAQFLGYKSIYCPKAIVFHKHKASAIKLPQHIEYWQFRNMYQTIIKDYPTKLLLKRWRFLKVILVYFNTIFYQIKAGFLWPPFFTTFWLIIHIPALILQRIKIQSSKIVSDDYIDSFLTPKRIIHKKIGG